MLSGARCLLSAFVLLCPLVVAAAAETPEPLVVVCRTEVRPELDGVLDDAVWQHAIAVADMRLLGSSKAASRVTVFRCLATADSLFVGVECRTPPGGQNLLPKAQAKTRDSAVYGDECFELYLQPEQGGGYYHFAVNSIGTRYDGRGMDKAWNAEWSAAAGRTEQGWQAELCIPFTSLGLAGAPEAGATWRFNLARNDRINSQYHTWVPLVRGFHEPESFGRLRFSPARVGVGPVQVHRSGRDVSVAIPVRSPPGQSLSLAARICLRSSAGQFEFTPSCDLSNGETSAFEVVGKGAWTPATDLWLSYVVMSGDVVLCQSAARTFPSAQVHPVLPDEPVPVVVQNGEISLAFDQATGRLLRAENKRSGLVAAFGARGLPVLELDVVRYMKNPRFFRDEDVQTLVPDHDTLVTVKRERTGAGETLAIEHLLASYLPVTLTVTVPPTGVEARWAIKLDNRLTYRPSRALVIHRVRYPYLSGVDESACGASPYVVVPVLMGQKIPEPGKNLGTQRGLDYIGRTTMGWFDFYGDGGGLYFKVGDVEPLPQTELILRSDPASRQLRLGIQRWALCWPGEVWEPGPCGLGVHSGDWHSAADLYRTWFRDTFDIMTPPQWLKDADGYVMSGGPQYEFSDLPRALENAQAIGLNYIELWSEMTGGDISYHAFAFPNPYMGTERELKRAIAELHAKGGHLGVYLNFNTGDPLLGTFVRQPRLAQKIPAEIPRPALDYMKDNWVQQSLMSHGGSYSGWNTSVPGYLDDYWNQCPGARKWTDFYYYWVIEKWAKEYDLDAWYLDSCPVSRGNPCFAFDHGHERPAPEGQSIIAFYRRLRSGAPEGFGIMQEYSSDRLLQYSTHALGLMWHRPFSHPEVVRYTLPEYPLFSGMCNGNKGLAQFYPGERLTPRDALERVFLIGNRFELPMTSRPPQLADDWLRQLVALRRRCREEMNYGDFLDDIALGPVPDRVHARLFRRADGSRLVVTILDRRTAPKREPFELALDLSKARVSSAVRGELVALDGGKPVELATRDKVTVMLTVPVYDGRPAAILLETTAGR